MGIEEEDRINRRFRIWKELIINNKDHILDLNQLKKCDLYDNISFLSNIFKKIINKNLLLHKYFNSMKKLTVSSIKAINSFSKNSEKISN